MSSDAERLNTYADWLLRGSPECSPTDAGVFLRGLAARLAQPASEGDGDE